MRAIVLAFLVLSPSIPVWATHHYIATNGTNSGTCTSKTSPCLTFNYVDTQAQLQPGDVVHVAAGAYSVTVNGTQPCVVTSTSGSASQPITWQSDTLGGAIIEGGGGQYTVGGSKCQYLWTASGSYQRITGFSFTGVPIDATTDTIGLYAAGGNGNYEVDHNVFHDSGANCQYTAPSTYNCYQAALEVAPFASNAYTGRTCTVHDNVFYNLAGGIGGMYQSTYNGYGYYHSCSNSNSDPDPWIYNNLFYNIGAMAMQAWHYSTHVHIYNTSDKTVVGIYVGSGDSGCQTNAVFDISNNIVTNSTYGIRAGQGGGSCTLDTTNTVFDNNMVNGNGCDWYWDPSGVCSPSTPNLLTKFANSSGDHTDIDPVYADESTHDYRLQATSPALGAGLQNSYAPATDLSMLRPDPPSIGASQ
jgi:hypothetical protein